MSDIRAMKRETDLISRAIIKQTENIFPDETKLILASTNLMRRITGFSKNAINEISTTPGMRALFNLFARNRELVHFSVICLFSAGYAPTKVQSRVALENTLCMRLFRKRPGLAKKWFASPDEFRKEWSPQRIRDELFMKGSSLLSSYNEFYWKLCAYQHPSFRGWTELIHDKANEKVLEISWKPVFNPDYASECFGLIFFIIVHSLQQLAEAFRKWIAPETVKEVNNIGLRCSRMVRRHFQVK